MTTKQEAREQGAQANYDGMYLVHNPWPINEELYIAWADGHRSAEKARNLWESDNHQRAVMYAD